jgi:hypothetical protein
MANHVSKVKFSPFQPHPNSTKPPTHATLAFNLPPSSVNHYARLTRDARGEH